MKYKYENYEIESLENYLENKDYQIFIQNISKGQIEPLKSITKYEDFKKMFNDIQNILTLSCKYGANYTLPSKLYIRNQKMSIRRYESYLNEPEDYHFMFDTFNELTEEKIKYDDVFFYVEDSFRETNEIPFIEVYNLLGYNQDTYIVPPFIDIIYGRINTSFEILPQVAPNTTYDDTLIKITEDDLEKYFKIINSDNINNNTMNELCYKIENHLHNYLENEHYKYITEPKINYIKRGNTL